MPLHTVNISIYVAKPSAYRLSLQFVYTPCTSHAASNFIAARRHLSTKCCTVAATAASCMCRRTPQSSSRSPLAHTPLPQPLRPPPHTGSLSRVVHWVVIAHATVVDRLREAKRGALGARPHRPSCRCVGVWPLLGVVYMHVQRKGCPSTGTGIGEEWCVSGGALPRADEGAGAG